MHTKEKRKERAEEMGKKKEQSGSSSKGAEDIQRDEQFKLCPSCGNFADFHSNEIYCILCGTRLLDACPECRSPIYYPTAKFCPSCGEKYSRQ